MAVIKQLLLSTGGGIISPNQQAEQSPNTATVLIGLGGTGVNALRTIKTEVYSRLKPDNENDVVPKYKHIRFLGIDTTEKTKGSVEHGEKNNSHLPLDEEEFLFIGDCKLSQNLKQHDILNKVEELEWFRHEDIKDVLLGDAGAGGVRQIGRYLFMNKAEDFANKLESHIRLALENLNGTSLYIHLFAGLSGGTGSGAFLDACYLIKKIAPNATVFGYFFLPDVNLAKISQANNTVRSFIKRNGYASLQELDYCMQLGKNGGKITQLYKGQNLRYIDWEGAPVNLCHIIGAESVGGRIVSNSYDYAMNVTAEYVMDFLTKVEGISFSLDQHLANCSSMMSESNNEKEIASEVFYAVIGASCAKIPNKEINTYLASTLFTKLTNVKDKLPTESDVNRIAIEAFAPTKQSVSDIYEEILREVRKGAGNDYVDTHLDWRYFHEYRDEKIIEEHYTNQRAAKYNVIEKNKEAMDSDENTQSLINKLYKVLNKEIIDVNKGPNYVYGVLNKGLKVNIENIIDGLIAENKNRKIQELNQENIRLQEYKDAKQECKDKLGGLFVNSKRLYNEYLRRVVNYLMHEVDIKAYEAVDELLTNLKDKISKSANGYYKKLSGLFNDLLETFELNKTTLDSMNKQNANDSFAEELISIHEIKDVLDKEVDKLSLDGFMSLLIQHLMKNDDEWLSGEENKIAKLVNDFFVEKVFNDFAGKAITSFLQMKYKTDKNAIIKQKIYDEWIKKLVAKSDPMFPVNTAVTAKLGGYGKVAFVSVPDTSSPIIDAAKDYENDDKIYVVKPSGLQDRIYIMSSICGMPLSAYSPLEQLEDNQFQSTAYTYGTHYYEGKVYEHNKGKENGFKEWNKLSPVIPTDLISDSRLNRMSDLNDRIKEEKTLFNKAIKCKILSDKDWYIYDYDEEGKNNIKELIEESNEILSKLEKPADIVSYNVENLIKQLDSLSVFKKQKTNMSLPVDGNDSGIKEKRDAIMFDHFFYAPAYMEKVKSILEYEEGVLSQIETVKKELITKKEAIKDHAKDIVNYSEAIFSGVISFNGAKMSFEKEDGFLQDTIVLTKLDEEVYPYCSIPLYQGYLNYQKLESDTKLSIRKKVNELLNDVSPQLNEVTLKLKEVLSKEKFKQWIYKAGEFTEQEEIKSVLEKIYKNFQIWDYK